MTHDQFIRARREKSIRAGISQSDALRLIDYLPKRYQYAHAFWSWVWMLSIPVAIILSISTKWWVGLIILVFVTPAIFKATKKSAAQFVLEHAEENEAFFNKLVELNFLVFKQ
jgi:hypothetical protein